MLLIAAQAASHLAAQPAHCDADLNPGTSNPLRYRLRGERCEGIYIQDVAATVLRLVSFTESYEPFDAGDGRPLVLEWAAPPSGTIHLRAQSLRHRLYYRMDSIRSERSISFEWPLDVVSVLKLQKNELGILAWSTRRIGSTDRLVYEPLRVRQREPAKSGPYRMVVVPGVQVEELTLSVAAVGVTGELGGNTIDKQPLGPGYYPAGRAVEIPVQIPADAGLYRVELGATLTRGGGAALTAYFSRSP